MPDGQEPEPPSSSTPNKSESLGGEENGREPSSPPAVLEHALRRLPEEERRSVTSLFAAVSRIGPDPATAKVLAEAEKHSEDRRLDGFKAGLEQRDREHARDHDYRVKQLNRSTVERIVMLVAAIIGVVVGIYLHMTKPESQVGGLIALASGMAILQILGKGVSKPNE